MYIQPNRGAAEVPVSIPEDYSGTVMRRHAPPPPEPERTAVGLDTPPESYPSELEAVSAPEPAEEPAAETFFEVEEPKQQRHGASPPRGEGIFGGLAARMPFLDQLLPPHRHGKTSGSDVALLAALCLLLSQGGGEEDGEDVLPLLLLLLFLQ